MHKITVNNDSFYVIEVDGRDGLVVAGNNEHARKLIDLLKEDGTWQQIVKRSYEKNNMKRYNFGKIQESTLYFFLQDIADEVNKKISTSILY